MRSAPVKRGCTTMRSPVERSITTSLARRQHRSIVVPVTRRANRAAVISRRTSGLATREPTIVLRVIAASRSRAIVSVSGSSGTAAKFAPSDVGAVVLGRQVDAVGVMRAETLCFVESRCDRRGSEDATTGGAQLAGFVAPRARVEEHHVDVLDPRQSHRLSRLRRVRVTGRRDDRGHGVAAHAAIETFGKALTSRDRYNQLEQRWAKLDQRKNRLRLRIAEPTVELDDLRPIAGEHEPRIQQARE